MLVLTRKAGEKLIIRCPDGSEIEVLIARIDKYRVSVGIQAPRVYLVDREEVVRPSDAATETRSRQPR